MIEHLKKIRNDVENGMLDHNNVLYIYIPSIYFLNDNSVDNISIMDMPGVGSRNHKEDFHIQNLMTKYIPISSVCIIACTCNEIQELETVVLPNNIDWKRMEHRFVLVVTRSYTTQNVKQYFKGKRNKRNKVLGNSKYKIMFELYAESGKWQVEGCGAESLKVFRSDYTAVADGKKYLMDMHIKYGVNPKVLIRIYFCWDESAKRIIVGHMPTHLATTKQST